MRYQIERKIKWGDSGDDSKGHPVDLSNPAFVARQPVQRDNLSIDPPSFLRRHLKGKDGAIDLGTSGLDGLTGFEGNGASKLLAPLGYAPADLLEHIATLPDRQATSRLKRLDSGGNSSL